MPAVEDTLVNVEILKNLLVTRATGGQPDEADYFRVRQELLKDPMARGRLPRFVRSCRTIQEFWSFIRPKFPSYEERRQFIADEFDGLLTKLEEATGNPAVDASSQILTAVDSQHVQEAWHKAMDRRVADPDGAITTARSLVETVCKYILDEKCVSYDDCAGTSKTLPAGVGRAEPCAKSALRTSRKADIGRLLRRGGRVGRIS